jgi:hypothetical protein
MFADSVDLQLPGPIAKSTSLLKWLLYSPMARQRRKRSFDCGLIVAIILVVRVVQAALAYLTTLGNSSTGAMTAGAVSVVESDDEDLDNDIDKPRRKNSGKSDKRSRSQEKPHKLKKKKFKKPISKPVLEEVRVQPNQSVGYGNIESSTMNELYARFVVLDAKPEGVFVGASTPESGLLGTH